MSVVFGIATGGVVFVLVLIVVWSINPEFELKWGWPLLMTVYLGVYLGVPSALVGAFFRRPAAISKAPDREQLEGLDNHHCGSCFGGDFRLPHNR